jgi:hypothetical protein
MTQQRFEIEIPITGERQVSLAVDPIPGQVDHLESSGRIESIARQSGGGWQVGMGKERLVRPLPYDWVQLAAARLCRRALGVGLGQIARKAAVVTLLLFFVVFIWILQQSQP